MSERVWQLRAMSVADLLDETIRLYRHNFFTFVGIAALLQAPMTLLSTFFSAFFAQRYLLELQTSVEASGTLPTGYFVYLGLIVLMGLFNLLVVSNLITAALARAIANRYLDEPVSIGSAYRAILRRFSPLLGALLLLVLINIGLGLVAIIPCVGILVWIPLFAWINIRLIFITQAVVLEECTPRQALSRSWDLVQGYGWRTFGVYLLIWLFSLLIVSLPSYVIIFGLQAIEIPLVAQTVISGVLSVALTVLYMPIRLTGMTLLYYDLRIRKEGLDLELQAGALGEGAGEPLGERTARDFLLAGRPSQPAEADQPPSLAQQASDYHDRGDLAQAIDTYRAAIAEQPDDALLYNDLGLALHDAGDLGGAVDAFWRAANLEPEHPTAYYNLALAYRDRDDLPAAREALRTYLELEPDPAVRASVEEDPELADLLADQ